MTHPHALIWLLLIPLIIWRIYRRIRQHLGPQKSVRWRHILILILYPLILSLIALGAHGDEMSLIAMGIGILSGLGLAVYSLQVTRFEQKSDGLYYTPSAHIGIALSILLIGRILYRLFELATQGENLAALQHMTNTPLTLLILGNFFAYYVCYTIGLLYERTTRRKTIDSTLQTTESGL